MTGPSSRTVAVPVKFLEHSRLRLSDASVNQGAGQGRGEPGDVLQPGREEGDQPGQQGGTGEGEIRFVVELKVEEIVDWLWEELKLPELKPKRTATIDQAEYIREGWDKRDDPGGYNVYFFYASDGENAAEDRDEARGTLAEIAQQVNYSGYCETGGVATFRPRDTQLAEIFTELKGGGLAVGTSHIASQDDVWKAIREVFTQQSQSE